MDNLKKIRLNRTNIKVSTSYWEDLPETGTHNFQKTISLEMAGTSVITMDVTTDIGSAFIFGEDVYSLPPSALSKIDYTVSIPVSYMGEKSVVYYFNLDGGNEVESDFLNSEGCHIKIEAYCGYVFSTARYRITFSLVYNMNTYHGVIFNETISKETTSWNDYHDFGSKEYSSSKHDIVYMR